MLQKLNNLAILLSVILILFVFPATCTYKEVIEPRTLYAECLKGYETKDWCLRAFKNSYWDWVFYFPPEVTNE